MTPATPIRRLFGLVRPALLASLAIGAPCSSQAQPVLCNGVWKMGKCEVKPYYECDGVLRDQPCDPASPIDDAAEIPPADCGYLAGQCKKDCENTSLLLKEVEQCYVTARRRLTAKSVQTCQSIFGVAAHRKEALRGCMNSVKGEIGKLVNGLDRSQRELDRLVTDLAAQSNAAAPATPTAPPSPTASTTTIFR